jgi:hypothetical protein
MIRKVKNIDQLPKTVEIINRNEALYLLTDAGVTNSGKKAKSNPTQMLNVWVNDENTQLDCYKVTGGRVEERGLYFRKEDIEMFINFKTMTFKDFKKMVKKKEISIKDSEVAINEEEVEVKGQQTIDTYLNEQEGQKEKDTKTVAVPTVQEKIKSAAADGVNNEHEHLENLGLVQFPKDSEIVRWIDFSDWKNKGRIVIKSVIPINDKRDELKNYEFYLIGYAEMNKIEFVLDCGFDSPEDLKFKLGRNKKEMDALFPSLFTEIIEEVDKGIGFTDKFTVDNAFEVTFRGYEDVINSIEADETKYQNRTIL